MATTTNGRLRLVRLVVLYLLISVAALWLAEGDASTTPSFIYQAF
ncbi:MAG: hypothetical protein ABI910_10785 [Gemmatimonadota bacterium]